MADRNTLYVYQRTVNGVKPLFEVKRNGDITGDKEMADTYKTIEVRHKVHKRGEKDYIDALYRFLTGSYVFGSYSRL
jgi:hypothetical protein